TISTDLECHACLDLNCSNRPVRTRTPGGVAGERPVRTAPYADPQLLQLDSSAEQWGLLKLE
ncbi:MAG: hypothetical protein JWR22_3092, partial [Herminiimonas sp.]|nr:hypothetical protein [Herminiimonas sp.]